MCAPSSHLVDFGHYKMIVNIAYDEVDNERGIMVLWLYANNKIPMWFKVTTKTNGPTNGRVRIRYVLVKQHGTLKMAVSLVSHAVIC